MKRFFDKTIICLVILVASSSAFVRAQPSPREILERVDANMMLESVWMVADMTIHYSKGDVRTLTFQSWSEGQDKALLEFTSPSRDAGSRFLRIEDNMWIFLPRVGKSVRIQGHMLRQGLMGSDFSYGDASEQPSLVEDYEARIERTETLDDRPTYVLYLTGKRDDLAYQMRRLWVDSERWVPLKEERFAKSGKLLKTSTLGDVRQIGDRWYPYRIELDNALQRDTRTTLQVKEFKLDAAIPADIFTLRYLEGGA